MLVNLDQLIEAAEKITPHNPLYQIAIRAFDSNGHVPMRVVLEIGGLPFALKVLGCVLPLGDPRVVEFNRRCERGVIPPRRYAHLGVLRVGGSLLHVRVRDINNQSKTRPLTCVQGP